MILRIEYQADVTKPRLPGYAFRLWDRTFPDDALDVGPDDVCGISSCWIRSPKHPPRTLDIPHHLEPEIRRVIDLHGCRVMVGNDFPELLFHHVCSTNAKRNVEELLRWSDWAYGIAGDRLALSPLLFCIIFDLAEGGRFLTWLRDRRVPMAWFWGWRMLFPPAAYEYMAWEEKLPEQNIIYPWHSHRYPFAEISAAIKEYGLEVWTGAGWTHGLEHGSMEKAEAFGYSGTFTADGTWRTWEETKRGDG